MKSKRAVSLQLVLMILALLFLAFFLLPTNEIYASVRHAVGSTTTQSDLDLCAKMTKDPKYKRYNNTDKDPYLDFCDNCPLVPNDCNPLECDKDGDLFVVGCCGNDGSIEYDKYGKIDVKSLPCKKTRFGIQGVEETAENDQKRNKHPTYKLG